jgi:hypothetical protein
MLKYEMRRRHKKTSTKDKQAARPKLLPLSGWRNCPVLGAGGGP